MGMLAAVVEPPKRRHRALPIPAEFDGLRILRRLGRGGMGDVYLADEPVLSRNVAVKVLRDAGENDWMREARIIGGLHCPGIVALHRIGHVSDLPYLVYEFVPGVSLSRATMPMATRRLVTIARDVASALAAVHAGGVVHADVKPANIMLAPDPIRPGVELPKLIDFGIARRIGAQGSSTSGTPLYMAPEVRAGATAATPRSDVYALGLVLLEMLTGSPNLSGLESLRAGSAFRPANLVQLLEHCVAKDPAARPSARDVALRLEQALDSSARSTAPSARGPEDAFAQAGLHAGTPHTTTRTDAGLQTIHTVAASILCIRQSGVADGTMAQAIVAAGNEVVARGLRPCVFVDAEQVTAETADYARGIEAWAQTLPVLSEYHVLGTPSAKYALRVRAHPNTSRFGAALLRAIDWVRAR